MADLPKPLDVAHRLAREPRSGAEGAGEPMRDFVREGVTHHLPAVCRDRDGSGAFGTKVLGGLESAVRVASELGIEMACCGPSGSRPR